MRATRAALIALGAVVVLYGAWLMVRDQSVSQLLQVVVWAAAAVIIHDGLLAPVAFGVGWLVQRRLPRNLAAPVAIVAILVGTIAVAAFAVLAGKHDGGANATLLDRSYPLGLVLLTAVAAAGVALGTVAQRVGRVRKVRGWRG